MAVVSLAILAYIAVVITGTYAISTNTSLAEQANLDSAISQQIASSLDYVHKSDINIAPLAIPLHGINLSANQFILLYDSTPYASEGHIALNLATEFTVNGADSISYKVSVTDMEKVTAAHIHKGNVGENGLVVVTLFKTDSPSASTNGILSQGTITSAKLEGPLAGKQLSDLINMINNGDAYVNVHIQANPKGEIRGQLSSM